MGQGRLRFYRYDLDILLQKLGEPAKPPLKDMGWKYRQAPASDIIGPSAETRARLGLSLDADLPGGNVDIVVGFWIVAILTAILPIVRIGLRFRNRRRRHHGLCAICGYDLRATTGRCPECGTETETPGTVPGISTQNNVVNFVTIAGRT
jgi:hypothetical protein